MSSSAAMLIITMFALSESAIVALTTRSYWLASLATFAFVLSFFGCLMNVWLWLMHSMPPERLEDLCRTMIRMQVPLMGC